MIGHLCWLTNEGLRLKNDEDTLNLTLFCLMTMSENSKNHEKIIKHGSLLNYLASKTIDELKDSTEFYAKFPLSIMEDL